MGHVAGLGGGGDAVGGQHDVGTRHLDGAVGPLDAVDADGGRCGLHSSSQLVVNRTVNKFRTALTMCTWSASHSSPAAVQWVLSAHSNREALYGAPYTSDATTVCRKVLSTAGAQGPKHSVC